MCTILLINCSQCSTSAQFQEIHIDFSIYTLQSFRLFSMLKYRKNSDIIQWVELGPLWSRSLNSVAIAFCPTNHQLLLPINFFRRPPLHITHPLERVAPFWWRFPGNSSLSASKWAIWSAVHSILRMCHGWVICVTVGSLSEVLWKKESCRICRKNKPFLKLWSSSQAPIMVRNWSWCGLSDMICILKCI